MTRPTGGRLRWAPPMARGRDSIGRAKRSVRCRRRSRRRKARWSVRQGLACVSCGRASPRALRSNNGRRKHGRAVDARGSPARPEKDGAGLSCPTLPNLTQAWTRFEALMPHGWRMMGVRGPHEADPALQGDTWATRPRGRTARSPRARPALCPASRRGPRQPARHAARRPDG